MDAIDLTPAVQSPRNGDVHFDIDLLNKCNLQCPTCFRGVGAEKNGSGVLPLDHFREIVAKARAEGYPNICLINWTEAFLVRNLDEYVRVVKEHPDLDCWVSSNLSLPPQRYLPSIISALAAGIDILFVSLSGWTQETYEINHKGGRIDWIKQNVAGISGALRDGRVRTSVWIRYLQWPYNEHEAADWARLAGEMRIGFEPVAAHGDPTTPLPDGASFRREVDYRLAQADGARFNPLAPNASPPADVAATDRPNSMGLSVKHSRTPEAICPLIIDRAAVDAKGDAYLCCAYPNEPRLKIGRYTDLSEKELFLRRFEHDFCKTCAFPARAVTERDLKRINVYFLGFE